MCVIALNDRDEPPPSKSRQCVTITPDMERALLLLSLIMRRMLSGRLNAYLVRGQLESILAGCLADGQDTGDIRQLCDAVAQERWALSPRQCDIARQLCRGLSNAAIGKQLFIAEQTVKFHLTDLYRKLGVSSRTEAVRVLISVFAEAE